MSTGRMERVKTALRTRGEVCAIADLYGQALANGRNDISELSRRGWMIVSYWCDHGSQMHKHYRLVSEPSPNDPAYVRRMRLVGQFSRGQR